MRSDQTAINGLCRHVTSRLTKALQSLTRLFFEKYDWSRASGLRKTRDEAMVERKERGERRSGAAPASASHTASKSRSQGIHRIQRRIASRSTRRIRDVDAVGTRERCKVKVNVKASCQSRGIRLAGPAAWRRICSPDPRIRNRSQSLRAPTFCFFHSDHHHHLHRDAVRRRIPSCSCPPRRSARRERCTPHGRSPGVPPVHY